MKQARFAGLFLCEEKKWPTFPGEEGRPMPGLGMDEWDSTGAIRHSEVCFYLLAKRFLLSSMVTQRPA